MTTLIHPLEQYVNILSVGIAIAILIGIFLLTYSPSSKLKVGLIWVLLGLFQVILSVFGFSISGIMIGVFTLTCGMVPISLSTSNMSKTNRMLVITSLMVLSLFEFVFSAIFLSYLTMLFLVASILTLSCGVYAFFKSEGKGLRSKISS